MPYHFLLADGEARAPLADILENAATYFPNLSIEYIRYPDDRSYSDFYRKMADAVGRVRTPYVMLADNDDFLAVAGIEQMLNFLEENPSYVCSTGRVVGFSVCSGLGNANSGLVGRVNRYFTWFLPCDASQRRVKDRIAESGHANWPYYAVARTEALVTIEQEAAEIDFSDLAVHETFHSMRMFSLGCGWFDPTSVTYFRQLGTSSSGIYSFDWGRHLIYGRLSQDIALSIDRISKGASSNVTEQADIAESARIVLLRKYVPTIKAHFGARQFLKRWFQEKMPWLLTIYRNRPRALPGRERVALFAALNRSGASPCYLHKLREELATVEEILSAGVFQRFLRTYFPLALETIPQDNSVPRSVANE